ncbi:cytochrome c biogenesis protein CcsA [Schlesneria sp. T3-172]|uniref:cytochrome c biogenesis protein n=1 Tax=Schlesneria sphaerica TaxID=3373610 RepID=UPI0037CB9D18
MATDGTLTGEKSSSVATGSALWRGIKTVLEPAASLKLTVVLFALSIFLILAGTFAQVDMDIWEVIGLYFRCWFAWVPFQVFFPASFFSEDPWIVPGGIYFPGGKLLGLLLAINLLSAHLVRFKAVARGQRLFAGLVSIALGCLVTWAIVAAGGNSRGIQGEPLVPYSTQWIGYQGFLGLAAIAAGFGFWMLLQQPLSKASDVWSRQMFLRVTTGGTGIGLLVLMFWFISRGQAGRPTDASLRILWQLTQGTVASLALLGGCWAVFGKRAGIVLLHGGIGLMMFYELHVALTAVETQMNLVEGERTNYVHDIRTIELAVSDVTDPQADKVIAIPKSLVLDTKPIDHPDLPFRMTVSGYLKNARIRGVTSKDKNPATAGAGLVWMADEIRASTGTDSDSKVDSPAAYVTLESKADGTPLGTYLVSWTLSMSDEVDEVRVGDKVYQIALRPKRYYKSYVFELKDVSKKDYLGTNTPRSYASTVHIQDSDRNVDEVKTIWMNNPLRFADETFYQSGYFREPSSGIEHATLSVVANTGWMMPYVGCMLVGIGMLTHFMTLLINFLTRGESVNLSAEEAERAARLASKLGMKPTLPVSAQPESPQADAPKEWASWLFASALAICAITYFGSVAAPPKPKTLSMDLYRFGQIPVLSEGRTKPLDTAATSALLAISGRTRVTVGEEGAKQRIPAIQWLLEVISEAKVADEREIFRVENLEVQETIGVKKREGMRYSRSDIRKNGEEFEKQVRLARSQAKERKEISVYQKKILELAEKVSTFDNLVFAFGLQHRIRGETQQEVLRSFQMVSQFAEALEEEGQPVFSVWPKDADDNWHILSRAWLLDIPNRMKKNGEEDQVVAAWEQVLKAYSDEKPAMFNQAVDRVLELVSKDRPSDVNPSIIRLESYFNYAQPFTHASRIYILAFVLSALGWLFWPRGFNRAAFYVLLVTLVVHTAAIVARLIISGRPPVTNLYSSAVFIGWGCVVMGLIFELIYRIGIGNLVAAAAGYATLLIADGLASDGDTFTVLQAVLDTQFWLATHVTCITLGYATTYLAGLFAIAYIIRGVCTPSLSAKEGRDIHRMIYGTLCFSIFFSFVGTVLGGLWADDSWGRFWGWDPKENAALIIVLWNAIALHARWGGMVKERGLAVLAVAGNIFVSWSWWGVNALGAGLHSYGFKQGTIRNLGLFILFNLVIIGIGMLPKSAWWSLRERKEPSVTQ